MLRYSVMPKGRFIPEGRKGRTMILVDIRKTPTARAADIFMLIHPGKDFEALTILRALVKGQPVDRERVEETGLSLEQMQDLVDRMLHCHYGAIFWGMGLTMTRGKFMNTQAMLALSAELNRHVRFASLPLRGHGNVTGAGNVMTWMTGYPFGVDFSRGYPRYNPGEFTTVDLLARGDVDAVLILGADPGASMPQPVIDRLASVPTIVLDPKPTRTTRLGRVHITTAPTGISAPGTVYRMDDLPLQLRPALVSPYPTDEEVVTRIQAAVASRISARLPATAS